MKRLGGKGTQRKAARQPPAAEEICRESPPVPDSEPPVWPHPVRRLAEATAKIVEIDRIFAWPACQDTRSQAKIAMRSYIELAEGAIEDLRAELASGYLNPHADPP